LSPYLGEFAQIHLINSSAFIDRLRKFTRNSSLSNLRIVSLDVTTLFTNDSLNCVLNILTDQYIADLIQLPFPIDVITDQIRLGVGIVFLHLMAVL
jgi:hypothetical protein